MLLASFPVIVLQHYKIENKQGAEQRSEIVLNKQQEMRTENAR
jgi:hypothetical protein